MTRFVNQAELGYNEPMRVEEIIWLEDVEDKIIRKHRVWPEEAEDVLVSDPHIRFMERGHRPGEDLYAAFGQTTGGRYLAVFFLQKKANTVLIVTARDMTERSGTMEEDRSRSSISKSRSITEMGEFWDSHDATDWDDQTQEVDIVFDIRARRHHIAVDPDLLNRLRELAYERGLSTESPANLMLQEKVLTSDS